MSFQNTFTPPAAVAITPSDTVGVNLVGLYVGTTGNVTVIDSDGNTTTFANCPTGFVITLHILIVKATGTTASNLVGYKPV